MVAGPADPKAFSLRRWSQRKHDAARTAAERAGATPSGIAPDVGQTSPARRDAPPTGATAVASPMVGGPPGSSPVLSATSMQPGPPEAGVTMPQLPAIDTLTIDSDYTGFMRPGVDDSLKCSALKKLFKDPRFNIMDGLDVYIDDYSKPDPIDPDVVRSLVQARYIFNPPATRVNAEGYVEDVPEAEPIESEDPVEADHAAEPAQLAQNDAGVSLPAAGTGTVGATEAGSAITPGSAGDKPPGDGGQAEREPS